MSERSWYEFYKTEISRTLAATPFIWICRNWVKYRRHVPWANNCIHIRTISLIYEHWYRIGLLFNDLEWFIKINGSTLRFSQLIISLHDTCYISLNFEVCYLWETWNIECFHQIFKLKYIDAWKIHGKTKLNRQKYRNNTKIQFIKSLRWLGKHNASEDVMRLGS